MVYITVASVGAMCRFFRMVQELRQHSESMSIVLILTNQKTATRSLSAMLMSFAISSAGMCSVMHFVMLFAFCSFFSVSNLESM